MVAPLAACSPTRPSCITDKSFQPLSLLIGHHCRGHPRPGERDPYPPGRALTLPSDNDRGLFPIRCEARERRPEHLVRGTHHSPPGLECATRMMTNPICPLADMLGIRERPGSALRPNAIVRGANRMPHTPITLPRLIVPGTCRGRRWTAGTSSPGTLQDRLGQGHRIGLKKLHPGCA